MFACPHDASCAIALLMQARMIAFPRRVKCSLREAPETSEAQRSRLSQDVPQGRRMGQSGRCPGALSHWSAHHFGPSAGFHLTE